MITDVGNNYKYLPNERKKHTQKLCVGCNLPFCKMQNVKVLTV